jgi:hypothetical protein
VTLLVSTLTQDCVWQVADRQLTNVRTGCPVDTDANKAVHFAGAMLFAYTGPAELEGEATASWIADRLAAGKDPDESLTILWEGLERAIRSIRRADLRAFSVDGVGWGLTRLTGAVAPRLLRFSNCIDQAGVWTGTLQDGVRMWDGSVNAHVALHMRPAGQPVPLDIGRHWERQIRRRVAAGARVADIGRCLVQLVRDVADAGNAYVGRGVLLSAIPRRAIEVPTGFTLASMPSAETATFKYFPAGADEGIDKGPEVANPGGFRSRDFWSRTDAAGNQIVQVSFRMPGQG